MRTRPVLVGIIVLSLSLIAARSGAQGINNLNGDCPVDVMKTYADLNAISDKAIAGGARVSRITAVACVTGSWGSYLWKVLLRAHDGRELEWKPSDGTNDLMRMLMFGR